jgi:hypothetical protein
VSFDVSNLFTNVPVSESVSVAEKVPKSAGAEPPFLRDFLKLLTVSGEENYFQFNGEYYRQLKVLAMGSPLSPLLAELFMDEFERRLFDSNSIDTRNIYCWFRYVDDVFAIWTGTMRQLDHFLAALNSISKTIVFTCEKESGGNLNFFRGSGSFQRVRI